MDSKLSILIADDEKPARMLLRSMLEEMDGIEVVGEAVNGKDALEQVLSLKPDLALLDLQMPGLDGLQVVASIPKDKMPLVVFVTAYEHHAVQAFELNALDYLLKPVEQIRLGTAIGRARERVDKTDARGLETDSLGTLGLVYDELKRNKLLERIPVKHKDSMIFVAVSEIACIVASGELLKITTLTGRTHIINYRLKELELRLDPSKFIRLSRGTIVHIDAVSHISPLPGGSLEVALVNERYFSVSRTHARTFRRLYLKL